MQIELTEMSKGQAERFWAKVKVQEPDECWPWKGGDLSYPAYGNMQIEGKLRRSDTIAAYLAGVLPSIDSKVLLHHACGSYLCCNPFHIRPAGAGWLRPTTLRGETKPSAKLTAEQVQDIRERYLLGEGTQYELSKIFGVSQCQIHKIIKNKAWKINTQQNRDKIPT